MSLTLRPFQNFFELTNTQSNSLFSSPLFDDTWGIAKFDVKSPALDMYDTPESVVVTAEVAGVSPEKIDLDYDAKTGQLKVSGETSYSYDSSMDDDEAKEHKDKYCRVSERRYGKFTRSAYIPDNVDEDGISANVEHGVLKVTLPKKEIEKKEKKKIKVNKL